jgi:radical SAM superfamily enzyme YgiQ (UPF0313 family)
MKNVYLFQPQYSVEYRREKNYWIPYSAGCIWSYVNQFDDIKLNFELKEIIFKREDPDGVVARMVDPVVCGFSCYVWNVKYCLVLAEKIKQRWPDCVIQFGGPQTSGAMSKYQFIDSIILGEGEEQFLESLRGIQQGLRPELFYTKQRLKDLDIPSPYTTGVFDRMMADHPNTIWNMTFETNRGCPYQCTFCDWGSLTYNKVRRFEIEKVRADMEWAATKNIGYLTCADANFGMYKERDMEIAKIIKEVADRSTIDSVNLIYAKNSTEIVFEIARLMGEYSKGVTVAVQSMHQPTLKAIKRVNMKSNDIAHMLSLGEQYGGVTTHTDIILGLPLETLESWKQGFSEILELGQHDGIEMVFSILLENSEMNNPDYRSLYGIRSIEAQDYMPFFNEDDWREVEETFDIVNQTNTMSTKDIIEGYLYGWMVIHFHNSGYSQLIAKYLRKIHGIEYRQYYDQLFEHIKTSEFLKDHYTYLNSVVETYLTTGILKDIDNHIKGAHGLHGFSYKFFFDNQKKIFEIARQVAESIVPLDQGVWELQSNYIVDPNINYPLTIASDVNINTWIKEPTNYEINSKIRVDDQFDFYQYRKQGLVRNKLTLL